MKYSDISNKVQELGCSVLKDFSDSKKIHLFKSGAVYVETATISNGVLKFNGKTYKTIDSIKDLIDEMLQVGNSKEFISRYYDPFVRRAVALEWVVDDYMKKIGFKPSADNRYYNSSHSSKYVMNDMYGKPAVAIAVEFHSDDEESGSVTKIIGTYEWVECKFDNVHRCLSAINTIIEAEALINMQHMFKCIEAMSTARSYDNLKTAKFNASKFTVEYLDDTKERLRKHLEDALASLA